VSERREIVICRRSHGRIPRLDSTAAINYATGWERAEKRVEKWLTLRQITLAPDVSSTSRASGVRELRKEARDKITLHFHHPSAWAREIDQKARAAMKNEIKTRCDSK
jgi:hypothetical protein